MKHTPHNIISKLQEHSWAFPDKVAYIVLQDGTKVDKQVTYRQLQQHVQLLAATLKAHQLEQQRVLLVYQDSLLFTVAFLSCQYLGIIPVPVSYIKAGKQMDRLVSIMEDAGVSAVLCDSNAVNSLQKKVAEYFTGQHIPVIDTQLATNAEGIVISQQEIYDEVAFLQYTSGSTGNPKGVIVSAINLMHNQQLLQDTFGCNESSVIFSWLPFHHDMGLIGNILHTIYVGCTCVLMSPFQFIQRPLSWLQAIGHYKVTHSGGPNFAYDLCRKKISAGEVARLDLSSWKVAYNGSEPVLAETMQQFNEHFAAAGFSTAAFTPCYGLAEATLLVSGVKQLAEPLVVYTAPDAIEAGRILLTDEKANGAKAILSSGKVVDDMEVKILSVTSGKQCGELEEGEILIAGESVTKGYWNKDNEAFFHILDGRKYLKTGDLGFLYRNELFVHGRIKELLIIRGKNVYPYDIEQAVAVAHESIEVNGVAAFSASFAAAELVIIAEIKRTQINGLDTNAVIQSIEKAVADAIGAVPYDILLTNPLAIPRTTSGKLQRVKCSELYATGELTAFCSKIGLQQQQPEYIRNPALLESVLASPGYESVKMYVTDLVLAKTGMQPGAEGIETVSLTSIGIDSLRAVEIITAVNRELSISIDPSEVLNGNTVDDLVNTIENMLWLKKTEPFGKEISI